MGRHDASASLEVPLGGKLLLGRQVEGPGRLDDAHVSGRHAQLGWDAAGRLVVEDLGSTNGTYLSGVRIEGPRVVRPGDELRLGRTSLLVEGVGTREAPKPERDTAVDQVLAEARALFHKKQYEAARRLFAQLVVSPPHAAEGHYGLGMVALACGDLDEAEAKLQKAISLEREHERAQKGLEMVREKRRGYPANLAVQPVKGRVYGRVLAFQERYVPRGPRSKPALVSTFRLEHRGPDGKSRLVPVELRGEFRKGNIANGDWVQLPRGFKQGRPIRYLWSESKVVNLTTGEKVSVEYSVSTVLGSALGLVFLVIWVVMLLAFLRSLPNQ